MVNKVILVGNLGKDPELKNLEGGNVVTAFSIATSESWKDRNGDKQSRTTWHNCEVWGKQAEIADKYLKKGSKIYLEGKIQVDEYEKDGQKRYINKINVAHFTMLDSKSDSQAPQSEHNVGKVPTNPQPEDYGQETPDDDLPF
tara:strand:- start:236 stop:664 length:429 start_codon:yes stop_codon:yes gene_type:complete